MHGRDLHSSPLTWTISLSTAVYSDETPEEMKLGESRFDAMLAKLQHSLSTSTSRWSISSVFSRCPHYFGLVLFMGLQKGVILPVDTFGKRPDEY